MRIVIHELGAAPLEADLRIEEQAEPDTSLLGGSDVVVAIEAAAVGWVDLLMMSGGYQHAAAPPYTPGLEYAGRVTWTGDAVTDLAVGDAVIADALRTGPRSLGAYKQYGGFARYAVAPADALLPLPEPLSFAQGCHLLSSYGTAYHCLIHRGRLQPGETVLILGATGATGLAAVQVAKCVGATVIAVSRSEDKLRIVAEQGADHTVVSTGGFRDAVKALGGADVVYDAVGGDTSIEALRCCKFGARFVIVGWASTPFVAKTTANVLPTNLIMMKGLDVLGSPAAISAHRDPSLSHTRLATIMSWIADGSITPLVAKTYPLSQAREALTAKWESRFVGGIVLDGRA